MLKYIKNFIFKENLALEEFKQTLLNEAQLDFNTFEQSHSIEKYKKLISLENNFQKKIFLIYNLLNCLICSDENDFNTLNYKNIVEKYSKLTIKKNYLYLVFSLLHKYKRKFRKKNDKIKVAFICHFFSSDISKNYLWPIVEGLNNELFEIFLFSDDETNQKEIHLDWLQFKKKKNFFDTSKLNYKKFLKLLYGLNLDIIFECNGHTDKSRFEELSYRPAKKQGTFFNILGPSGFDFIDFIPIRKSTDTQKLTEMFKEKLVFFENYSSPNFSSYPKSPSEPPCINKKFITFGYFGGIHKVTKKMFLIWLKILNANSNSKLYLKCEALDNEKVKYKILNKFKKENIEKSRIILNGISKTREDYLKCYNDIDISFTTHPHNGGSTFIDSLIMGVPIFILNTNARLSSQIGSYHLNKMNLNELIVNSYDDYFEKYLSLAENFKRIVSYKKTLRSRIIHSEWSNKSKNILEFEKLIKKVVNN